MVSLLTLLRLIRLVRRPAPINDSWPKLKAHSVAALQTGDGRCSPLLRSSSQGRSGNLNHKDEDSPLNCLKTKVGSSSRHTSEMVNHD